MMKENAIVVMLKVPKPGKVKTRLVPPLDMEEAAGLYRCFIEDTISRVQHLSLLHAPHHNIRLFAAYTPQKQKDIISSILPSSVDLMPQRGCGLGERLFGVFEKLFTKNYKRVVVIGSDSPDIPLDYIRRAFELLTMKEGGLVIGPSEDGGYYLIAMDRPWRKPFDGIPWGTCNVLEETIKRCKGRGIEVSLLPPWRDIDTIEDITRLIYNPLTPASRNFIHNNLPRIINRQPQR
ncbi:MAG: TIGR04282 family arsenosugar biosynthesis glycosyltransferase [Thermodesulfobacteriota bacterium]